MKEARGAKYLDKYKPGWFNSVDINKIKMSDYRKCILGQLYGTYHQGLQQTVRPNTLDIEWSEANGFDSFASKDRWITEIENRRSIMSYPTKEQVLSAAKESSVHKALQKLFPEHFKDFELPNGYIKDPNQSDNLGLGYATLTVRSSGNLAKKGFYLARNVNWEIKTDNENKLVLVPTRK